MRIRVRFFDHIELARSDEMALGLSMLGEVTRLGDREYHIAVTASPEKVKWWRAHFVSWEQWGFARHDELADPS